VTSKTFAVGTNDVDLRRSKKASLQSTNISCNKAVNTAVCGTF
jgi:hypothetical protein